MGAAQYKIGLVSVTNSSQIWIGASTDWLNQLSVGDAAKVDRDNESTYIIGNIISATRMIMSSNYTGSTDSGLNYMVNRDYTVNRSYWRPAQGDYDFAELLSQEVIDKIDEDIDTLFDNIGTLTATEFNAEHLNASLLYSKAYQLNIQTKTSNYTMGSRDHIILASGDLTIYLASGSNKYAWEIVNITLATPTASINVVPTGGDSFLTGESNMKLASKGDIIGGFGSGGNYQVIDKLRRGVEISW